MRKLLLTLTALAIVVGLSSTAHVRGIFDKDISVPFDYAADDLSKIILPPPDSEQCQRIRIIDDTGGATDTIDMKDGSTQVITYEHLPFVSTYITYHPSEGYTNCDSFSRGGLNNPNQHGPIATWNELEGTAEPKSVRFRQYNQQGKLVRESNLIEEGKKSQTDYYNEDGLITHSTTYDLVYNVQESETSYRADGTRLMRQSTFASDDNFVREYFSRDGKVLVMKEERRHRYYALSLMYANGETRFEGEQKRGRTEMKFYRSDGTAELDVQLSYDQLRSARMVSFEHFDRAGKKHRKSIWMESEIGEVDANGYRPLVLWRVSEVTANGRPTREFNYRPDGTLLRLTLYKNKKYLEVEVEYNFNDQGSVISWHAFDKNGNRLPAVNYVKGEEPTTEITPVFSVPDSYRHQPQFSVPAELTK